MGKNNRKKNKNISPSAAMRVNRNRPKRSRAMDAVRPAKKIDQKPTKKWARNPSKRDIKGIDDGSKKAKARNHNVIKEVFGKMGKKGAAHTNAKNASEYMQYMHSQIKLSLNRLRSLEQQPQTYFVKEEIKQVKQRIDERKKEINKQQRIAVKWQGSEAYDRTHP